MGYGSDRWWRVQVIVMFAATVAIVVLGAYQYFSAPLRFESSILAAAILHAPESPDELCIELAFSNVGTQQIKVTDVSLRLVRHDPPRWHLIPGRVIPEFVADRGLILTAGEREQLMVQFPLGPDDALEGLGIGRSGRHIVEGSLLVTVVDRHRSERLITVGGLSAVVQDGSFREMSSGDAVVRYAGD